MSYHSTRMIRALEERIERLNKENIDLRKKLDKAVEMERAGVFYLRMQRLIAADQNILDAWRDFYTILALATSDTNELEKDA